MFSDIRFALRSYGRTPGFAIVAVIALALGIGANTAMFSALDAVLLRQLPYREPDRLVMLWEANPKVGGFLAERLPASFKNLLEWKRRSTLLDDVGFFQETKMNITGGDKPEQVEGTFVSTNFLNMLGVQPVIGRSFTSADATNGRGQAAIISSSIFERRFNKDRSVIGKTIRINDANYTVLGVLPEEFHLPAMWEGFDYKKPDLWLAMSPAGLSQPELEGRSNFVFARMKAGVTVEQLRAEMLGISRQLQQVYPAMNDGFGISVFPLFVEDVGAVMRRTILVLQFAVAFVLLIACANVANLLLARAASREKEISIRVALGAARSRLVRQMLAESLVLSGFGALGGIALAWLGIEAIRKLAPSDNYHLKTLSLDGTVLAFTLAAALLTGLIFGLAPSIHAARQNVNESLGKGGRGGGSGVTGRLRNILVITEVALALVLLAGAGLMIRSMTSLLAVAPGFRTDHLLTLHINQTSDRYKDPKQVRTFTNELLDRIARVPGVQSAGISEGLPMLDRIQATGVRLESGSQQFSLADHTAVSDGFFETLGAPILRGRSFTRQDAGKEKPEVAVVNETLARNLDPKSDVLGKVLVQSGDKQRLTIVGIKADTHQMGLDTATRPEVFLPSRVLDGIAVIVRTEGDPMRLAGAIQNQIWEIDRNQPVAQVMSMDQQIGEGLGQRRFNMLLFEVFAALALLLASVGIYGVLAYAVTQRTRELGIRIALGAAASNIAGLVLRQGLILGTIGVAIGSVAAYGLTRWMASLIYGVSPTDPATFSAVAIILIAIALIASYIPARRAMRVDPMQSLRSE